MRFAIGLALLLTASCSKSTSAGSDVDLDFVLDNRASLPVKVAAHSNCLYLNAEVAAHTSTARQESKRCDAKGLDRGIQVTMGDGTAAERMFTFLPVSGKRTELTCTDAGCSCANADCSVVE